MKKYTLQKINIPSGNYRMKLLILSPTACKQPREKTPGILWIHGGGYAVGMAEMVFMSRAKKIGDGVRCGGDLAGIPVGGQGALPGGAGGLL